MAILKNLIVHGPSHFIGKVFINDSHIAKINESDVPENPKFTDTVSSMSTTGTGNAITNVSVSNGSFTFTKGSTFLTSQTTAALYAGTSAATANTSAANTSAHLILKDGTTYNRIKIQGTAGIEVTASSNGVLSVGVPAQSPNTFYAGPSSGTNAVPNFRNIGLADLPHDTTITSNSSSQNIPTTSAVSAYVNEEVDKIKIGGRNLILDTSKTMISPESTNNSAYVFIYLSDYGNSVIDNNTTDFFTYSFDYEVTGNTAEGAFIYAQIRGTSVNNVVSGYSVFPSEAPVGKYCCVFKLTNAQSTSTNKTASIRLRNATNGAILTVKNAKLERGNKATDWTPAPEDLTIQTEELSEIANLALTEGIEYIVGTQEAATSSWEGKTRDSKTVIGKTIAYKLPVAGSTVGTTTLTLVDKVTGQTRYSGEVKMNNSPVTTHYPANSIIKLTYDGTDWRSDFYNTNTYLQRANTTASASFLPILMGNHATSTAPRSSTGYKDVTRFAYQPSTQTLKVGQVSASRYTGSGVLETQLTSNTTDDNKLPTALAIKNSLGYVTPQMFGAIPNDENFDCTSYIQQALDSSLNVYFPPGVYWVSNTLSIRSGSHIWGTLGSSHIKAMSSFTIHSSSNAPYDLTYMLEQLTNHGNFLINDLTFNCNDVVNLHGLRFFTPYNRCVIKNVTVDYCQDYAICVGNGDVINSTNRSQTLVVDNCLFLGSNWNINTGPLAFFRNTYELNLKDTKIMFRSGYYQDNENNPSILTLRPSVGVLELNYCFTTYMRGCSLTHSPVGLDMTGRCRYFRLIGNTFEKCTVYPIRLMGDDFTSNFIDQGIIIETLYNSTPRVVSLMYAKSIIFIGNIDEYIGDRDKIANITVMDMYSGQGKVITSNGTDPYTSAVIDDYIPHYKEYTLSTTTNSAVSPWGAIKTQSISSDITKWGDPVGVIVKTTANNVPASANIVGTNLVLYTSSAASNIVVRVLFCKQTYNKIIS